MPAASWRGAGPVSRVVNYCSVRGCEKCVLANSPAPALELREGDDVELDRLLRSTWTPTSLARRAPIVALAADGRANSHISEVVGCRSRRSASGETGTCTTGWPACSMLIGPDGPGSTSITPASCRPG